MILSFAWWGMKRSICSCVKPCSFRSSDVTSAIAFTATLKVSFPFILMYGSFSSTWVGSFAGRLEPPPGMQMKSA